MRVYLSGPMRGRPDLNRHSFDFYCESLHDLGVVEIFNPWASDPDYRPGYEYTRDEMVEFMFRDLAALNHCGAIFLMPEWWTSKGAVAELAYAHAIGIPATDYRGYPVEFNSPRPRHYCRPDGVVTAVVPLVDGFYFSGVSGGCSV